MNILFCKKTELTIAALIATGVTGFVFGEFVLSSLSFLIALMLRIIINERQFSIETQGERASNSA